MFRFSDEMNVYSEELFNLYIKNTHQDIEDIGRHFAKIKGWILKNLSMIDWWETAERYLEEYRHSFAVDDLDPDYAAFQKKLSDKCIVSNGDLPDYISQVDRCLRIALLIHVVMNSLQSASVKFSGINNLNNWRYQAGWEAVHALTLLKHGKLLKFSSCKLEQMDLFKVFHVLSLLFLLKLLFVNISDLQNPKIQIHVC